MHRSISVSKQINMTSGDDHMTSGDDHMTSGDDHMTSASPSGISLRMVGKC